MLRLTLLRSPDAPDPTADTGHHHFTYSILPHRGHWRSSTATSDGAASTVAEAYVLNNPLLVLTATPRPDTAPRSVPPSGLSPVPMIAVDRPNVLVETIKWAEDGNGLIVRLYENERCRGPVRATVAFPFEQVESVDLLERPVDAPPIEPTIDGFEFTIAPYQIRTFRIT